MSLLRRSDEKSSAANWNGVMSSPLRNAAALAERAGSLIP